MQIFDGPFFCPLCDGVLDIHGDHCLVCSGGGDRTKRHNLIRNQAHHHCLAAGFSSELERPGLLRPRPLAGGLEDAGGEVTGCVLIPRLRDAGFAGKIVIRSANATSADRADYVASGADGTIDKAVMGEAFCNELAKILVGML